MGGKRCSSDAISNSVSITDFSNAKWWHVRFHFIWSRVERVDERWSCGIERDSIPANTLITSHNSALLEPENWTRDPHCRQTDRDCLRNYIRFSFTLIRRESGSWGEAQSGGDCSLRVLRLNKNIRGDNRGSGKSKMVLRIAERCPEPKAKGVREVWSHQGGETDGVGSTNLGVWWVSGSLSKECVCVESCTTEA